MKIALCFIKNKELYVYGEQWGILDRDTSYDFDVEDGWYICSQLKVITIKNKQVPIYIIKKKITSDLKIKRILKYHTRLVNDISSDFENYLPQDIVEDSRYAAYKNLMSYDVRYADIYDEDMRAFIRKIYDIIKYKYMYTLLNDED